MIVGGPHGGRDEFSPIQSVHQSIQRKSISNYALNFEERNKFETFKINEANDTRITRN